MTQADWLLAVLVFVFTAVAAVIDSRTRKVPNWLTVPAFAAGLLFHLITGGLAGLGNSLAGFAIGFGILFVLWLIGGGGGGDVKLMGALGAWVGFKPIVAVFFISVFFAVMGGILVSIGDVFKHGTRRLRIQPIDKRDPQWAEKRVKRRLMPYAVPVALSTWLVLAYQVLVRGS